MALDGSDCSFRSAEGHLRLCTLSARVPSLAALYSAQRHYQPGAAAPSRAPAPPAARRRDAVHFSFTEHSFILLQYQVRVALTIDTKLPRAAAAASAEAPPARTPNRRIASSLAS